jgi:hypothetical protein
MHELFSYCTTHAEFYSCIYTAGECGSSIMGFFSFVASFHNYLPLLSAIFVDMPFVTSFTGLKADFMQI